MARFLSPTVPANFWERRIIAIENFMLHTPLRGPAALEEFNRLQAEQARRLAPPLVPPDPYGRKLEEFFARIDDEVTKMRGTPRYWKYHQVRKG